MVCERIINQIKSAVPHDGKLFEPLVGDPVKWMYNARIKDALAISICIDAYTEVVDAWLICLGESKITKHVTITDLIKDLKQRLDGVEK